MEIDMQLYQEGVVIVTIREEVRMICDEAERIMRDNKILLRDTSVVLKDMADLEAEADG